jgi:hypothetical protein
VVDAVQVLNREKESKMLPMSVVDICG